MRERSNSLAELLSLSSSSSDGSKRVLMRLYCCVISALSKSVVEVMAVASVACGGGDGVGRPQCQGNEAWAGWGVNPGERRQQRGSAMDRNVRGVKFRRLRWLRGDKRDEHLELNVLKSLDSCRKLVENTEANLRRYSPQWK